MEYRFTPELRADGRALEGTAIRYGDIARLGSVRERFEPRSVTPAADGVILNVQHDRNRPLARTGERGGLELLDSSDALRLRAALPNTREADDTLELVRRGVLRGLSVEFDIIRERWDGMLRIVERALLSGIGVVDRPAYPQSAVHARRDATGARVGGFIAYGAPIVVGVPSGERQAATKEMWMPGAFDYAIEDSTREINLVLGGYDRPLASKMAATLNLETSAAGVAFDAPLPATTYASDFIAASSSGAAAFRAVPRFSIPPRAGAVAFEEEAGTGAVIRVINEAVLSAIVIATRGPRGAPADDPAADPVYGATSSVEVDAEPAPRRRKVMVI